MKEEQSSGVGRQRSGSAVEAVPDTAPVPDAGPFEHPTRAYTQGGGVAGAESDVRASAACVQMDGYVRIPDTITRK